MTKQELIRGIQDAVSIDIPQKGIIEVLNAIETVVKEAVLKDDEVTIPGICKLKTKVVPERTGTMSFGAEGNKRWVKPEHKKVCVSVSSSLKNIFE